MTDLDGVVNEMVRTVGGLGPVVQSVRAEWEGDDPPETVLMGYMGRSFADLASGLDEAVKRRFFGVIERALDAGDQQLADVVATGFLEAMVHAVDRHRSDAASVYGQAGPAAVAYIEAYNDFTLGPAWRTGSTTSGDAPNGR